MRKDVKKLLFFGLEKDKNKFFKEAQILGQVQFIDQKNRKIAPSNATSDTFTHAIKVLRGLETSPQLEVDRPSLEIAKEIVDLKKAQDKLEEELRILRLEIERIQIFGNFSIADIKFIEEHGRFIQFFSAKQSLEVDENLIFIDSRHGLNYYVSIQPQLMTYPGVNEMKIEIALHDLHEAVKTNKEEHRKIHAEVISFSPFNDQLHKAFLASLDSADLAFAKEGTDSHLDGKIFVATGFVPEDKISTILSLAKAFEVHAEEIAIEESDAIPTYLENENVGRMGEDLVAIYDTPSPNDKDPSHWVFFSFLLFFSMIIGDGGYGSVFLGLALYLRYKFPDLDPAKKRMLNLFTILSACCIAWGILTTSFFGISFSEENPMRRFSLVHFLVEKKAAYHLETQGQVLNELYSTLSDQVLLELALFIGGFHIFFGMGRYVRKNPSNIGWMIFIVGAYLYLPVYLGTPTLLNYTLGIPFESGGAAGLQMISLGIPAAIGIAVFRNGLIGLTEVMNLIQVFADALSYLRLYALGLSGSILSATINNMAGSLPFLVAVFLILIGHLVNMLLGVMGGVIHGLRLNFIEWYHYSFEGGGKPFKPLKINSGEST